MDRFSLPILLSLNLVTVDVACCVIRFMYPYTPYARDNTCVLVLRILKMFFHSLNDLITDLHCSSTEPHERSLSVRDALNLKITEKISYLVYGLY